MKRAFLPFINRRFSHTFGAGGGDFTASQHLKFLLKAETEWADGKYKDDYVAHVDCVNQLLDNQTARISQLDDTKKDNMATVTWLNACGIVAADVDTNCDIDEVELDSDSIDYEMTLAKKTGFSVDAEKNRTNIYELDEEVASGLLRSSKVLDEWWAMQVLLAYKMNAGVNIPAAQGLVAPFTWDDAGTTTNIPAASFNVGIVASLMRQMQLNMVSNAFFVDAGALFEPWYNAKANFGNLDGKGDQARIDAINLAFDMWNFQAAGLTEEMFMVAKSAIAMKTYNRMQDAPLVLNGKIGQTWYTMPSKNLKGVKYDVIYQMTCQNNGAGKSNIFHTWRLQTQGGIWCNPTPCPVEIGLETYTPTGVYSFTKTA